MSKFFMLVDKTIEWFVSLGMATLVIVCMLSVVFRYFLGSSLFWADEFMRYLFANVIFYGCPLLVYKKAHIVVDITDMLFSSALRKKLMIANDLLFMILGVHLAWVSIPLVRMGMNQTSSAMGVQMSWVFLCMPVGFALVAINGLRLLIRDMQPSTLEGEGS